LDSGNGGPDRQAVNEGPHLWCSLPLKVSEMHPQWRQ
jgi:hypothetical protein